MNSRPTDKILCGLFMLFFTQLGMAQSPVYTRDDTLRGCITPQRDWWDLTFYKLKVKVNPADKSIYGCNEIRYKVLNPGKFLQIDLQPPLQIERAEQDGQALGFKKQGRNAYFIELNKAQPKASLQSINIWYSGIPQAARNAPWDGGFSWKVDEQGLTFAATSCQGLGASIWWPCKDHMYDEPDSLAIFVTVPNN